MIDLEKLLREAGNLADCEGEHDLFERLWAAADHVAEHKAEYALAEWKAGNDSRESTVVQLLSEWPWRVQLWEANVGPVAEGYSDTRAAAILAALAAWEGRK